MQRGGAATKTITEGNEGNKGSENPHRNARFLGLLRCKTLGLVPSWLGVDLMNSLSLNELHSCPA